MNYLEDFPMLKKGIVYFDNAATTYKPKSVINSLIDYNINFTANSHRGDYNNSFKVDDEIDKTREKVKKFINADLKEEIIFTMNATDSLNMVVNGFFEHILNKDDEVILSKSEHASNILPWIMLSLKKGIKIKYIPLDEENKIKIENIKNLITNKTKVISLAYMTNVIGDKRNIKEISKLAHNNNIYMVVDGAQSVPHIKTDVKDMDCDFLAFSAHKMCGPTGVGVLYGKYALLKKMIPYKVGGGMNESYNEHSIEFETIPLRFEAGTPNINGIIAFRRAIEYIENIGLENIERSEKYLRKYLVRELSKIPYIDVLNPNSDGSIVLIKVKDKFAGDVGLYLNSKGICVRSGKHCVKMLKDESGFDDTVRISLYFYNTYEEIDYLIYCLKDKENLYNF